jgi:hypothetical protein
VVAPSCGFLVQGIAKPRSRSTGIGRYTAELEHGLPANGPDVRRARLESPPSFLVGSLKRAGYDLDSFVGSYRLRADVRPGYLTHLSSQTLATLLFTQRFPRPMIVTAHDIFAWYGNSRAPLLPPPRGSRYGRLSNELHEAGRPTDRRFPLHEADRRRDSRYPGCANRCYSSWCRH